METLEELTKEAKRLLYFLCPAESHGESPEAEQLDNILNQIERREFK